MLLPRLVTLCTIAAFISGCSSIGDKEPFQIYAPRTDCVSCKKQENWGFIKRTIYRHNTVAYFASFQPKASSPRELERIGLCYGTALDTIKAGATHFRILDKEKWGDWHEVPTPATVSVDIFGTGRIYSGGMERKNQDQSGMWWANHYYEVGSPSCKNSSKDICSEKHKFNLQDCPYEGEGLRKETEEKRGSLACVMKRNPRLLLHKVYYSEAGCGFAGSVKKIDGMSASKNFYSDLEDRLEIDYWVPANDVIKKFEVFFKSDE